MVHHPECTPHTCCGRQLTAYLKVAVALLVLIGCAKAGRVPTGLVLLKVYFVFPIFVISVFKRLFEIFCTDNEVAVFYACHILVPVTALAFGFPPGEIPLCAVNFCAVKFICPYGLVRELAHIDCFGFVGDSAEVECAEKRGADKCDDCYEKSDASF